MTVTGTVLENGFETTSGEERPLSLIVPVQLKRRGGRKTIARSDAEFVGEFLPSRPMTPIQQALASGHRWLALLEAGHARTMTALAECEGVDRAYMSRSINLTLLAPDIVVAILDETLPSTITLFDLASGTPLLWEAQRAVIEGEK